MQLFFSSRSRMVLCAASSAASSSGWSFQIRIALLQRCREQMVTKRGVLRQDRAVAVCAEDILIAYALIAVLPVVAAADEHLAERRHAAAKIGLAAVVFKPTTVLPPDSGRHSKRKLPIIRSFEPTV